MPHWDQPGAVAFVTWRTKDSLPRPVLDAWLRERAELLARQGIDAVHEDWRTRVDELPDQVRTVIRRRVHESWEQRLDECHGTCPLRDPDLAKIVSDSLHHFDGERYVLSDFVVMPNHVHVLAAFEGEGSLLKQCASWKRFTATRVNRRLGRSGRFWQEDGFDHLVRSPEQFVHYRRYIAENPVRVGLRDGEFVVYQHQPIEESTTSATS